MIKIFILIVILIFLLIFILPNIPCKNKKLDKFDNAMSKEISGNITSGFMQSASSSASSSASKQFLGVNVIGTYGISPFGTDSNFIDNTAQWIWWTTSTDTCIQEPVTIQYTYTSTVASTVTIHALVNTSCLLKVNSKQYGKQFGGGWDTTNYPKLQVEINVGDNIFEFLVIFASSTTTNSSKTASNPGLLVAVVDNSNKVLFHSDGAWTFTPPIPSFNITQPTINAFSLGAYDIAPWSCSNFKDIDSTAQWIWYTTGATTNAPTDNTPANFQYIYLNDTNTTIKATLYCIVDNSATIKINNVEQSTKFAGGLGSGPYPHMSIELVPCNNLIEILAMNAGGPAGLLVSVIDEDKKVLFNTDSNWVVTLPTLGTKEQPYYFAGCFNDGDRTIPNQLGAVIVPGTPNFDYINTYINQNSTYDIISLQNNIEGWVGNYGEPNPTKKNKGTNYTEDGLSNQSNNSCSLNSAGSMTNITYIRSNNIQSTQNIIPVFVLGSYNMSPWNTTTFIDHSAKWIWYNATASTSAPTDTYPAQFLYTYNNINKFITANVYINVDTETTLYLNNVQVSNLISGYSNNIIKNITILPGSNEFNFKSQNTGGGPAGLLVSVIDINTNNILFNSNSSWYVQLPDITVGNNSAKFIGCYKDSTDRALPNNIINNTDISGCLDKNETTYYPYIGLQDVNQCWAGSSNYNKYGLQTNYTYCDITNTGPSTNMVYSTGLSRGEDPSLESISTSLNYAQNALTNITRYYNESVTSINTAKNSLNQANSISKIYFNAIQYINNANSSYNNAETNFTNINNQKNIATNSVSKITEILNKANSLAQVSETLVSSAKTLATDATTANTAASTYYNALLSNTQQVSTNYNNAQQIANQAVQAIAIPVQAIENTAINFGNQIGQFFSGW